MDVAQLTDNRHTCVYTKVPRGLGNRGMSWKIGDSTYIPQQFSPVSSSLSCTNLCISWPGHQSWPKMLHYVWLTRCVKTSLDFLFDIWGAIWGKGTFIGRRWVSTVGTNGRVWKRLVFSLEKGSCLGHPWILRSGTWAHTPKFGPSNPRTPSSPPPPILSTTHLRIYFLCVFNGRISYSFTFICSNTRTEMYKSLREIQMSCVDKIVSRGGTITSKPAGENWADLVHCVKGWSPSSLTREKIFLYGYQNPGETAHAEN
jgi:hypothetical protein